MSQVRCFITFEGVDGAGKSTHLRALAEQFEAAGSAVVRTREPGGTALGERLRELALRETMDPLTEALIMFAARRQHLSELILPALARGAVVLCDRFSDATFAYQGGGRGFDWDSLVLLERLVQGRGAASAADAPLLQPDLTLWFDVPPEVAAQRLAAARAPDKFEREPLEFFRRVRAAYARRAEEQPARMVRIDADRPPAQVRESVIACVRQRGWL